MLPPSAAPEKKTQPTADDDQRCQEASFSHTLQHHAIMYINWEQKKKRNKNLASNKVCFVKDSDNEGSEDVNCTPLHPSFRWLTLISCLNSITFIPLWDCLLPLNITCYDCEQCTLPSRWFLLLPVFELFLYFRLMKGILKYLVMYILMISSSAQGWMK